MVIYCYTYLMDLALIIEHIHTVISPGILVLALIIALLLSGIMTLIFFYHWDRYGTNSITTIKLKVSFVLGILGLLSLAVVSLLLY